MPTEPQQTGWYNRRLNDIDARLAEMERVLTVEAGRVKRILVAVNTADEKLTKILALLTPTGEMALQWGQPSDGTSTNVPQPAKENTMSSSNVPGVETDSQTIPCSEIETDGAGNPVTLNPANVQWAIDDSTVATLTQNSDGSATFKAVKPVPPAVNPRTANVTCTDTATGVVGTDSLQVTDSPVKPGAMVLTFGTPA